MFEAVYRLPFPSFDWGIVSRLGWLVTATVCFLALNVDATENVYVSLALGLICFLIIRCALCGVIYVEPGRCLIVRDFRNQTNVLVHGPGSVFVNATVGAEVIEVFSRVFKTCLYDRVTIECIDCQFTGKEGARFNWTIQLKFRITEEHSPIVSVTEEDARKVCEAQLDMLHLDRGYLPNDTQQTENISNALCTILMDRFGFKVDSIGVTETAIGYDPRQEISELCRAFQEHHQQQQVSTNSQS